MLGLGVSIILAGVLLAFGQWAFWVFSQDTTVIAIGVSIITITFPCYWIYVFLEVFAGSIRGRGNSVGPMIIILANICILRTVLLGILSTFGATVEDIAWLYPVTWLSTSVCMAICYGVVINKKASRIPKCV